LTNHRIAFANTGSGQSSVTLVKLNWCQTAVIVSLVRTQLSITRVGHLQPRRERLQFTALIQRIGNGKSASTVRMSVGLASNFADV